MVFRDFTWDVVFTQKEIVLNVVIRVSEADRARPWGLLVRRSPGTALPNNTFIVSEAEARALREAGIDFEEIARFATGN